MSKAADSPKKTSEEKRCIRGNGAQATKVRDNEMYLREKMKLFLHENTRKGKMADAAIFSNNVCAPQNYQDQSVSATWHPLLIICRHSSLRINAVHSMKCH